MKSIAKDPALIIILGRSTLYNSNPWQDDPASYVICVFGALMTLFCCAVFFSFFEPVDVSSLNSPLYPWNSSASFRPPLLSNIVNTHPVTLGLYIVFIMRISIPTILLGVLIVRKVFISVNRLYNWVVVS